MELSTSRDVVKRSVFMMWMRERMGSKLGYAVVTKVKIYERGQKLVEIL